MRMFRVDVSYMSSSHMNSSGMREFEDLGVGRSSGVCGKGRWKYRGNGVLRGPSLGLPSNRDFSEIRDFWEFTVLSYFLRFLKNSTMLSMVGKSFLVWIPPALG